MAEIAERVIPGVGVWTPRESMLEGEAHRLRGLAKVEHTVKRLIVNVHEPADLAETLANPRMEELENVRVNYISGYTFSNLGHALATARFDPKKLTMLSVTGNPGEHHPRTWHMETLRRMYRPIAGATVKLFSMAKMPSKSVSKDTVVWDEEHWFRHRGSEIAVSAMNMLWMAPDIVKAEPKYLFVDCEDQFHFNETSGPLVDGSLNRVEELWLVNVAAVPYHLFELFDKLNLPSIKKVHLISEDNRWNKALKARAKFPVVFNE